MLDREMFNFTLTLLSCKQICGAICLLAFKILKKLFSKIVFKESLTLAAPEPKLFRNRKAIAKWVSVETNCDKKSKKFYHISSTRLDRAKVYIFNENYY